MEAGEEWRREGRGGRSGWKKSGFADTVERRRGPTSSRLPATHEADPNPQLHCATRCHAHILPPTPQPPRPCPPTALPLSPVSALPAPTGNRKNILVSCPLRKKLGRYFMALVRNTAALR